MPFRSNGSSLSAARRALQPSSEQAGRGQWRNLRPAPLWRWPILSHRAWPAVRRLPDGMHRPSMFRTRIILRPSTSICCLSATAALPRMPPSPARHQALHATKPCTPPSLARHQALHATKPCMPPSPACHQALHATKEVNDVNTQGQRTRPHLRRRPDCSPALGPARRTRTDRHQVRLRRGAVRRLHRASGRRRGALLPGARSPTPPDQEIVTIEGLDPEGNHPVQRAWRETNAPQCGYCHAGQIMQAAALLATTPKPTRRRHHLGDVRQHLPMRLLPAHRRGGAPRLDGSVSHDTHVRTDRDPAADRPAIINVSRRFLLKGLVASGALVRGRQPAAAPRDGRLGHRRRQDAGRHRQ